MREQRGISYNEHGIAHVVSARWHMLEVHEAFINAKPAQIAYIEIFTTPANMEKNVSKFCSVQMFSDKKY